MAGALLVLQALLTIFWQDPVTAVVHARAQKRLERQLTAQSPQVGGAAVPPLTALPVLAAAADGTLSTLRPVRQGPGPLHGRRAPVAVDPALVGADPGWRQIAQRLAATTSGHALGRLSIPRIGLSDVVVQGTDHPQLKEGPGHYAGTSLPGLGGTVGLAGHRTTYGAPFRHLDALRPGMRITVRMSYATFTYAVQGTKIVSPSDASVLSTVNGPERLVMTTCNPLYSSAQRLVVTARLVRTAAPA